MRKILIISILFFNLGCNSGSEWVDLFNGENLDGWHIYLQGEDYNGWYVDNGVLVFDPEYRSKAHPSNLVSDNKYENFELSLEWMISENGNSGVFWGVVEDEKYEHPYQTGPEVQILDDNFKEYVEERGDIQRAGSIFNLIPPSKVVSKPAGEWNKFLIHINHVTNVGFVKFNDQEIMRFQVHGSEWDQLIAGSNFADWSGFGKARSGYICLQDHGNKVAFRNIKIRELTGS